MRTVPGVEVNGKNIVSYEEQILDENLPSSMIIGGSGAIGVEFAYVFANFGVDVTIVEFLDRMVPTEDADVSKELAKHYKKLGVKVLTSTAVKGVEDTGSGVKVRVAPAAGASDGQSEQVLEADKFLAAFGFAPRVDGYGLEAAGVQLTDRGAVEIDDFCRTNVEGVYAIGDCTGKLMLAHVAEAQGHGGLARGDELHVVDRGVGGLDRRGVTVEVLIDDLSVAAADGIVDAAGATSGYRKCDLRGAGAEQEGRQQG